MKLEATPMRTIKGKKMNQNYAFWFTGKNLRRPSALAS
jgi:hypothetical protein